MDIQTLIDELRDAAYDTGYYAGKIEQAPGVSKDYAAIQKQAIERRSLIHHQLIYACTAQMTEIRRLELRDELFSQLMDQIKAYYGGTGGLATLQDGYNRQHAEIERLSGIIASLLSSTPLAPLDLKNEGE